MKKVVLFGHRGVGKSSLLRRLAKLFATKVIDLDFEIEQVVGCPITQFFLEKGEAEFRRIERETFEKINSQYSEFICAVGGGFPVQEIPRDIHSLWVQRPTDSLGRIFLNRPRLDLSRSDRDEFIQRARDRSPKFLARADEIYLAPEGIGATNATEQRIFSETRLDLSGGILTLLPWHISRKAFLSKVIQSGFELRNDLLSAEEVQTFLDFLGASPARNEPVLLSCRTPQAASWDPLKLKNSLSSMMVWVDWPLELGAAPPQEADILSSHDYLDGEDLSGFLSRLEAQGGTRHLKAAPVIEDITQLKQLVQWQMVQPEQRSILPRSSSGKWNWIRLYMKGRQKINFWKDGEGSAPDQPSLYQWLSTPKMVTRFAAVLGRPVNHSRSPVEHQDFFALYNMPFFAIDLSKEEFVGSIEFLVSLGLSAAAVTSPHKEQAYKMSSQRDAAAASFGSANSLVFAGSTIHCSNTDINGLYALKSEVSKYLEEPSCSVAIWGGGGTLEPIKKTFPQASAYSLRSGKPREGEKEILSPTLLIWAAGPLDTAPSHFKNVKVVIDLNYRDDSAARVFAKENKAHYLSGEVMFLAQAKEQRVFFAKHLKK